MTGPIETSPAQIGTGTVAFRTGTPADTAQCLALWIDACATRDGEAIAGVENRARPKFDRAEKWLVAEGPDAELLGFVLATTPGSGLPGDPPDAPVVGLIAVAPRAQGHGLGAALLNAVAEELAQAGHDRAVLHVLMDNQSAVRLYAGTGWQPLGQPFEHSLLKRPTQAYILDLLASSARRPGGADSLRSADQR